MSYLCWGLINFNQDISKWNTSNVIYMQHMFVDCQKFNQNITIWNTSKVIDMSYMFYGAENFNQDISKLDTSNVLIMDYMLFNAFSLNYDLSDFNISSCNSLNLLFGFRDYFPFNLSKWKFKKAVSAKFLYTFFDVNLDQIELIPEQCLNISNNPYENFITFAPYFYFDYDRLNDFDNKIIYPKNKESECENTSDFFYNIKFTELAQLNFKLLKMNFIDSFYIPKNFLKNKTFKLMKANMYPLDSNSNSVDTLYFLSSENKNAFFVSKEFVHEFLRISNFNI